MSKLEFKKEQILILAGADLDQIVGGMAGPVSSALRPTATAVSSARPGGGGFAHPTATAVSSARPGGGGHGPVSSALKPTATAVSSAHPPVHHHHSLSSVMPHWGR